MKNDRRTFLKTAALAGAAATSGLGGLAAPAAARTGGARAGTQELPKGMTSRRSVRAANTASASAPSAASSTSSRPNRS
jgi:hypothetical protein